MKSRNNIENFTRNALFVQKIKFPKEISEISVDAEINHGRLIAKCPFCSGAELVDKNDKRFFCLSCYNKDAEGKWLKVNILENLIEIEKILEPRKEQNQNWFPSETVEMLKAEVV